jgi:hypothetical protein
MAEAEIPEDSILDQSLHVPPHDPTTSNIVRPYRVPLHGGQHGALTTDQPSPRIAAGDHSICFAFARIKA